MSCTYRRVHCMFLHCCLSESYTSSMTWGAGGFPQQPNRYCNMFIKRRNTVATQRFKEPYCSTASTSFVSLLLTANIITAAFGVLVLWLTNRQGPIHSIWYFSIQHLSGFQSRWKDGGNTWLACSCYYSLMPGRSRYGRCPSNSVKQLGLQEPGFPARS